MSTAYRKKLIEVALPLKAINDESALRKRKAPAGYPTTLHKWWAQRPLAACRAVLFASLVDDPSSDPMFCGDENLEGSKRAELFNLIEDLVLWENSNNANVINKARAEIARCVASRKLETGELKKDDIVVQPTTYAGETSSEKPVTAWDIKHMLAPAWGVNQFLAEYAPPVLDPFCGGGSIPLEAQRLGLRVFASDLNPVAVLITKALVQLPPNCKRSPVNPTSRKQLRPDKWAWTDTSGLAADVRYYGNLMRDEAHKRIGHLYPNVTITKGMAKDRPDLQAYVGEDLAVIAWLWSRTIECPNPACRARAPMIRSFWLSKKTGKKCFARPVIDHKRKSVTFQIATDGEPLKHTTDRNGARCLFCDTFIRKPQLRELSVANKVDVMPLAIVVEGNRGRMYLSSDALPPPTVDRPEVAFLDHPMTNDKRWFSPPLYGLPNFSDLYTARQLVALTTLSDVLIEVRHQIESDARQAILMHGDESSSTGSVTEAAAYADAVATFLACALSRAVDYNSSFASWRPKDNAMRATVGKQAIPMVWDFAEANPFEKSSAGFSDCTKVIAKCVELLPADSPSTVKQGDATAAANGVYKPVVCTDPPYYDNIGYADISDYFYVWLRRSIAPLYPELFSTVLTPKSQELIASAYRHGGNKELAKRFFEDGLGEAFRQIQVIHNSEVPFPIFYAFKQSETDEDEAEELEEDTSANSTVASTGWETMLEALINSKFAVTGTWPMRTEGDNRQVGISANALASSIVLVCRARPADAPLATRKEFLNSLREELPEALRNLQRGNIAPVDLAQASIGPGMAVFTRYSRVVESDGTTMAVRTALGLINQALDEVLTEQEGEFDPDTRWAIAWFDQFAHEEAAFGIAETLSKAKNVGIDGLREAGIVEARAGKVRLLKREELADDWDPETDGRITIWEVTQHLIRALEQRGETGAAELLRKVGSLGEVARDLAYRLYTTCERKKWAQEAISYNSLVTAWPEISRLSRQQAPTLKQTTMLD
jgi:putative DNA methylase